MSMKRFVRVKIMVVINHLIAWLRHRKHFGVLRFNIERLVFRMITFFPTTRHERLKFILKYMPALKMTHWIGLPTLDIGCVDSLLLYELKHRNYRVFGMDMRDYNSKLPKDITFIKHDILKPYKPEHQFYYIIATSVIELLGCGVYGEEKVEDADRIALENIHAMLLNEGYFILSLPTHIWRAVNSRGYGYGRFMKLIHGLFYPIEVTQCGGHLCAALIKVVKKDDSKHSNPKA